MADTAPSSIDFRQMLDNGAAIAEEIEADAKRLAEKMERIHGEAYCVLIDHEVGLVVVRGI
ncbi:MAG: hypothetical protein WBA88_14505 [Pseudaminobacter sp.]